MEGLAPLVATKARSGCSALGVVWVREGAARVTAVAKVTLGLQAEGVASPKRPASLVPDALESPRGYLRTAGDLAPLLPKADILVVGFAPGPSSGSVSALARLGYWRGSQILVDKNVALLPPKPGQRVPVHGLGPLRARSRERMRWLNGHELPTLGSHALSLPVGIDPAFFNTAPRDQQVDGIRGGDGLLLDSLVEGVPRVTMNLPDLRGFATLTGASQRNTLGTDFDLEADTLVVDLDRGACHVVLRGDVPLEGDPKDYRLIVGVRLVAPSASVAATPPADAKREPQSTANLEAMPDHLKSLGAIVQPKPAGHAGDPRADLYETVALSRPPAALAAARAAVQPDPSKAASDKARRGPSSPPPSPSATPATGDPASAADEELLGTAEISAEDVARLVAQQATPFSGSDSPPLRRAAPSAVPPATPFDRRASAGDGANAPSSIPPAPLPATGARPPDGDRLLWSTADIDAREVERFVALQATPFEGQQARSQPPPAASSNRPPPQAASSAGAEPNPGSQPPEQRTAELEAVDRERAGSRPATPFSQRRPPAVPPSTPPPPTVGAATRRRRDIPGLGATVAVEDSDQVQLAERRATPFTQTRSQPVQPVARGSQPPPATAAAATRWRRDIPGVGATMADDEPEPRQLRAQPATPFSGARSPEQPPPPPAQPSPFVPAPPAPAIVDVPVAAPTAMPTPPAIAAAEPPVERPDGFGAAFLDALAEVDG